MDNLIFLDKELTLYLNGLNSPALDAFFYAVTSKWLWVPLYATILWMIFRRQGGRGLMTVIVIGLLVLLADQLTSGLMKPLFERLRPTHDGVMQYLVHTVNGYRGGLYGFPSCHAANSVALTVWFFLLCGARSRLSMMLLVWCLLTCYTRMYLGVHYPGDLLFGSVVGSLCALLCWFLAVRIFKIGKFRGDTATQIPLAAFLLTVTALLIYSIVAHLVR